MKQRRNSFDIKLILPSTIVAEFTNSLMHLSYWSSNKLTI